ncbi:hypothetical protein ACLKR1_000696 [Neisseria gonorrhoeae]
MKPAVWAALLLCACTSNFGDREHVWAALLLCACTSNFGDREHQFLRYSGLTKTSTALPRLSSKRTIL